MLPARAGPNPDVEGPAAAQYTGYSRAHRRIATSGEGAAMTLAGLIVCAVGVLGFLANYTGFYPMSGVMADMRLWVGVMVIGALTAVFTRRAND